MGRPQSVVLSQEEESGEVAAAKIGKNICIGRKEEKLTSISPLLFLRPPPRFEGRPLLAVSTSGLSSSDPSSIPTWML